VDVWLASLLRTCFVPIENENEPSTPQVPGLEFLAENRRQKVQLSKYVVINGKDIRGYEAFDGSFSIICP
jgi:hypothetical protein